MKCTYVHTKIEQRECEGKKKMMLLKTSSLETTFDIQRDTHCDLNGEFKNTEKNYTKYLIVQ